MTRKSVDLLLKGLAQALTDRAGDPTAIHELIKEFEELKAKGHQLLHQHQQNQFKARNYNG